jgi:hypothetical protein
MTVSKYMPVCACGLGLRHRDEIACPECLALEGALLEGALEDEIVGQLERDFGHGWFTVRMAGLNKRTAQVLVRLGRLDVSKTPNTGTFNYRVKP